MAGMGIAAAPPQDAPAAAPGDQQPQDQAQASSQDDGPEPNVTPEEQAQYDQFVGNGMKLVYRGEGQNVEVNPAVLEQLRGHWDSVKPSLGEIPQEEKPLDPKNPSDNLAVATVALVLALEASAASQKKQVDPSVLFHGATELMEQLADIADAASIHNFTTDELTGAANRAAMLYGVSSKTVNKQQALAEFDHFLQTQGDNLGQSLQGISEQGQGEEQAEPTDNPQEDQQEQR